MNRLLYPIIGILLAATAVVQMRAARSENVQTTQTAAVSQVDGVVAEGRVATYPGSEVTVGSDVAGRIDMISVEEQGRVRKGDVIAIVNSDETRAALSEARARVGELEADIRLFELESARARELFAQEVGSRQLWDKALRDIDAASARRKSVLAEVDRLEALLAKSRITAPLDGVVITRHVDRGENIVEGDDIATVANLDRLRIESEVDEYDTARVRMGSAVRINAEGYDGSWRGIVEEIPDSMVSRRMNPPDPSKPIDTRVLLVKIAFAERVPLKLGQRVEVRFESQ